MQPKKMYTVAIMYNEFAERVSITFDKTITNKYNAKNRRPTILYIGNENESMESLEQRIKE
jgi:hypothetical protein